MVSSTLILDIEFEFFGNIFFTGYGSLTPKTVEGKIVTMAYAIVGVPLMLMCLSNLGRVLAAMVRDTYARLCIRQSDHFKYTTEDSGGGCSGIHGVHGDTYQSAEVKNEVTRFTIITKSSDRLLILFSSFRFVFEHSE